MLVTRPLSLNGYGVSVCLSVRLSVSLSVYLSVCSTSTFTLYLYLYIYIYLYLYSLPVPLPIPGSASASISASTSTCVYYFLLRKVIAHRSPTFSHARGGISIDTQYPIATSLKRAHQRRRYGDQGKTQPSPPIATSSLNRAHQRGLRSFVLKRFYFDGLESRGTATTYVPYYVGT